MPHYGPFSVVFVCKKGEEKMSTDKQISHPARKYGLMMIVFLLLTAAIISSVCLGAANIDLYTIWDSFFHFNEELTKHQIIREVRIPRALAAAIIGAFLGISGAIMQGMTRNPLGDPSIMGITSGAAFTVALAFAFFPNISNTYIMLISFVGALMGALLVFGVGALSKGGLTPVKLALAGAAVSALLSSLSTAIAIRFNVAKNMNFWFAGSIAGVKWSNVYPMLMIAVVVIVISMMLARSITILSLGEEVSKGLGQRTWLVKFMCTMVVLIMAGVSVSVAGIISFVGLIVPHITRALVGVDYRFIIPFSGLFGALLLVVADIGARMIQPPFETPVGAITTLLGGPFFLYLARREGGNM
jgi:iron complex transport system permease protein